MIIVSDLHITDKIYMCVCTYKYIKHVKMHWEIGIAILFVKLLVVLLPSEKSALTINCFSMRIWHLLIFYWLLFYLYYFQSLRCGTTGVVTFIRGNMLHVAWVGDSQVMLVRKGQAVELMKPHKPDREVSMLCSVRARTTGSLLVITSQLWLSPLSQQPSPPFRGRVKRALPGKPMNIMSVVYC